MPPSVVTSSDRFHSGTTSVLPLTLPSHQANDILLIMMETNNGTVDTPSGWTAVTGTPVIQPTGDGDEVTKLNLFWKRAASSSEPNLSLTGAWAHSIAGILVIRGCRTSGTPFLGYTTGTKYPKSFGATMPGITTTAQDSLVLFITARGGDAGFGRYSGESNATYTVTEVWDNGTAQIDGGGIAVWKIDMTTSGATGNVTATADVLNGEAYWTGYFPPAENVQVAPADATFSPDFDSPVVSIRPVGAALGENSLGGTALGSGFLPYAEYPSDDELGGLSLGEHGPEAEGGGGSTITAEPNDLAISLSFESPTATKRVQAAPDDAGLGVSFDSPSATVTKTATPDDAGFSLEFESPSTTRTQTAAPDGAQLSLDFDSPSATRTRTASPEDALLSVEFDEATASRTVTASPEDVSLELAYESPSTIRTQIAQPEDLSFSVEFDEASVTRTVVASPSDALLSVEFEEPTITKVAYVQPDDATFAVEFDQLVVTKTVFAEPYLAVIDLYMDEPETTRRIQASPADLLLGTSLEETQATLVIRVSPDSVLFSPVFDEPTVTQHRTAVPEDAALSVALDAGSATRRGVASPEDVDLDLSFESPATSKTGVARPSDLSIGIAFDEPEVSRKKVVLAEPDDMLLRLFFYRNINAGDAFMEVTHLRPSMTISHSQPSVFAKSRKPSIEMEPK